MLLDVEGNVTTIPRGQFGTTREARSGSFRRCHCEARTERDTPRPVLPPPIVRYYRRLSLGAVSRTLDAMRWNRIL